MKATVIYPADERHDEFRHTLEVEPCRDVQNRHRITELLERIWRDFNCVDGTELCVRLRVRSMCVGDIVHFPETGRWFIVEGCGWYEATAEQVEKWKALPFDKRLFGPEGAMVKVKGRTG